MPGPPDNFQAHVSPCDRPAFIYQPARPPNLNRAFAVQLSLVLSEGTKGPNQRYGILRTASAQYIPVRMNRLVYVVALYSILCDWQRPLNLYHSLDKLADVQVGDIFLIFFFFFFFFFSENRLWHFMQIVFIGDNSHEMSNLVFWEKLRKIFQKCRLLKFLPRVLTLKEIYQISIEICRHGFYSRFKRYLAMSLSTTSFMPN